MLAHVEVIDPMEKVSPQLGGTGYVGPKESSTSLVGLAVNARHAADQYPELNATVWKVLKTSVDWRRYALSRRLRLGPCVLKCEVIGSVQDWWFVSVNASEAAQLIEHSLKEAGR